MSEFKAPCGCEIHVAQWTSKRKIASTKSCPLHKNALELLSSLRHLVHQLEWHIQNNADFGADRQRVKEALAVIAKVEGHQ